VAVGELIKVVTSVIVIFWQDPDSAASDIYRYLIKEPIDLLKVGKDIRFIANKQVSVPSILYAVQNNLLFYALSHLQVPHYQVGLACGCSSQ
jgi:hypothetical protein